MVSRKPDAICLHCGTRLDQCDVEYTDYIDMSEKQRDVYKEKYKQRIQLYFEKIDEVIQRRK